VFHSVRSAHVIRGVERFLRWVHSHHSAADPGAVRTSRAHLTARDA
jgi:hypothetical protein